MKKLLVFVLMFAVLLSACGTPAATPAPAQPQPAEATKAPEQPQPVEPTKVPEQPAQPAGEPVEITYMLWGSPEELAVWQKIVDEFQATDPNIKVNVDVSDWESYWNKLKTLYAGGTPPDVFAMDGPLYPDWVSRDVLLNLQPYLDKSPDALKGIYPGTLAAYQRPDGYYGLPRDFQTIVLFYNKDLFDQAGVPYPTKDWTMNDLREASKKLTKDNDGDGKADQWGFSTDLWDMEQFWGATMWGFGGDVINADRTQTLIGGPKSRDGWKFISGMMNDDKSMPSPEAVAQFGDPFAAGVAAMTTSGHWMVPEYQALEFNWDVAAFPAGPEKHATSVNSAGFVVAKDSKHPEAAWEFIKYALGPTGQTRLTELGFAIPVLQAVAESPVFLQQEGKPIDQQVFLDALKYAVPKPSFKGYDEWATTVGDNLIPVWNGEMPIDEALDQIVPAADDVLAKNK
jgi:multiple sugar transport system substrate-binding protein